MGTRRRLPTKTPQRKIFLPYEDVTHPRYRFEKTRPRRMQSLEHYEWHEISPSEGAGGPHALDGSSTLTFQMDEKVARLLVADSVITGKISSAHALAAGRSAFVFPGGFAALARKVEYRINNFHIKKGESHQNILNIIRKLSTMGQSEETDESSRGFYYLPHLHKPLYTANVLGSQSAANGLAISKSYIQNAHRLKDVNADQVAATGFTVDFELPIRDIVEMYNYTDKLSFGATHHLKLTLIALNQLYSVEDGGGGSVNSVTLSDVQWHIPAVRMNELARKMFYMSITNLPNLSYTLPYKHWEIYPFQVLTGSLAVKQNIVLPGYRPTHILIAQSKNQAQTDITVNTQDFVGSFDAAAIKSLNVRFNGKKVMHDDYDLNFTLSTLKVQRAYNDFLEFMGKDLRRDVLVSNLDWAVDKTIFVIDLTKLSRSAFDPNQSSNTLVIDVTLTAATQSVSNWSCVAVFDRALQVSFKNDRMFYRDMPRQP